MMRIVICRHGNTFDKGDVVTRVGARTDLPLSKSGAAQARQLAAHFSASDIVFSEAFCSSLKRTQQTAEAILTSKHVAKKLKSLQFLTEIDYGVDENAAEEDVVARLGQEAIDKWDRDAIPPRGWQVEPKEIIRAWEKFFENYRTSNSSGDILVATSNGIARFALDAVDEIATDAPRKLRTAAYGVIEIEGGISKVKVWDKRATD
ncbi:histidine phosphatase family protein [Hellea balneolensis]|uniref:histidine phosphatase family protein n=1 Tax=Hellea balneolensis TaxID=287478 RepID=UPI0004232252|nr:histidine phosphatase family protein [Hellea balneolensis]